MDATAILPVKRFGAAKSRLAESAAAGVRPDLARAMLADVLAAIGRCRQIERVVVVSGDSDAQRAAEAIGAEWIEDSTDSGHSRAAGLGVARALADGAACVALLPGDCPLLSSDELDAALGELGADVAGVIPDRHGAGTNGLLLSPPDAIEPSFGPGSRDRHLELAAAASVEGRVLELPSLALDLDTAEDLAELARLLRAKPYLAPTTAAALERLTGAGRP